MQRRNGGGSENLSYCRGGNAIIKGLDAIKKDPRIRGKTKERFPWELIKTGEVHQETPKDQRQKQLVRSSKKSGFFFLTPVERTIGCERN